MGVGAFLRAIARRPDQKTSSATRRASRARSRSVRPSEVDGGCATRARRRCRWRCVRTSTSPTAAPEPIAAAATGRAMRPSCAGRASSRAPTPRARRRPGRRASRACSSSRASSSVGGSTGRERPLEHRLEVGELLAHGSVGPSACLTISSSCRMARCSSTFVAPSVRPERPRDLAVVHPEREAHDQRLAAVVRQLLDAARGSA